MKELILDLSPALSGLEGEERERALSLLGEIFSVGGSRGSVPGCTFEYISRQYGERIVYTIRYSYAR